VVSGRQVRENNYFGGVHLVDGNDELPYTKGESQKSVLASLTVLGDTSLEFTSSGGNDEHSAIGLGSASNHVFDEITMAGGINNLGYDY
jgi:hypothetical protein